jgi:hypothetical protein
MPFAAALEAAAANTVFTTHTPVPAGHDHLPTTWSCIISASSARRPASTATACSAWVASAAAAANST